MRKALVRVLAEIPVDGVGSPGRLSGVRVRCAVPGNADQVVELCGCWEFFGGAGVKECQCKK